MSLRPLRQKTNDVSAAFAAKSKRCLLEFNSTIPEQSHKFSERGCAICGRRRLIIWQSLLNYTHNLNAIDLVCGEMPEWSNGTVSKTVVASCYPGFESLSLRHYILGKRKGRPNCFWTAFRMSQFTSNCLFAGLFAATGGKASGSQANQAGGQHARKRLAGGRRCIRRHVTDDKLMTNRFRSAEVDTDLI